MKVSYKVLKKYLPNIKTPEEVAQDLIMHTAEVEEIHTQWAHLENVFIGEVIECKKHPEADRLNICQVNVWGETRQIICGAPNVTSGIKVAVALPWAELKPGFIIQKSKIRGETSNGMICSEDELGLIEERQDGIMILPENAPLNTPVRDYFEMDDVILEIDNKAINHRPDLFSHIGIAREIAAIDGHALGYDMTVRDFNFLPDLWIKNYIPAIVKRYMGLKVSGVKNSPSPQYIKDVLNSHDIDSKGILIDITNYSLYLYGQPTHCFDADKLKGAIHIRYAKTGESFIALNDKTYTLEENDIVIADDSGVIALWGIIWGKDSAVSKDTKNIVIESAWFDQAVLRKTGKRLGIRTDALNVFEKDLVHMIRDTGPSLIVAELEKHLPNLKLEAFTDVYTEPWLQTTIDFDIEYINRLIGKQYSEDEILHILETLGIIKQWNTLIIPLWRKDITKKADIAEEVARISGYDKIPTTVPRINLWAISQTNTYKIKRQTRNFLISKGFFDIYNYSFVNSDLMQKYKSDTENLIPLKNALSEEITHMRDDLIPNLLLSLENNTREYKNLKLFEIGKVFHKRDSNITENYELSGVVTASEHNIYYATQNIVSDICHNLEIDKFHFDITKNTPNFSHPGRTATLVVRGKEVGIIWEIHPEVTSNFDINSRVWYFKINIDILSLSAFSPVKAKEISSFQENNFDINFVVNKEVKAKDIQTTIEKANIDLIRKVELFDIYEDELKLPWQRSLSYTVYFWSLEWTLDDSVKNTLIKDIVKKVEKKGGKLR